MFLCQGIYAASKRHKLAICFDFILGVGCAVPVGIWTQQYYLMQVCFTTMILGNFMLAYELRKLQNMPTSTLFMIVCLVAFALFAVICLIGVILPCDKDDETTSHILQAIGYAGLMVLQMFTMVMMCTVR